MNRYMKWVVKVLAGSAYMALAVLLGRWLLQGLGMLTGWLGGLFGLEPAVAQHLAQSLGQLQDAKIQMPWIEGLLFGALLGALSAVVSRWRWGRITVIVLAAVLFIPLVLAAFCLTQANDVMVLGILVNVLPLLTAFL